MLLWRLTLSVSWKHLKFFLKHAFFFCFWIFLLKHNYWYIHILFSKGIHTSTSKGQGCTSLGFNRSNAIYIFQGVTDIKMTLVHKRNCSAPLLLWKSIKAKHKTEVTTSVCALLQWPKTRVLDKASEKTCILTWLFHSCFPLYYCSRYIISVKHYMIKDVSIIKMSNSW